MKVTDEMLMALADGELDVAVAEDVARAVDADPILKRRLEEFERTRVLAKKAFAGVLEEPVPAQLVAAIGAPDRTPAKRSRSWLVWWPAGAVAVAGIAGFVAANLTVDAPGHSPDAFPDTQVIAGLLESTPSGETIAVRDAAEASFAATGSFAVPDGICRTFTLDEVSANAPNWRGVACHEGEVWTVEILVAGTASGDSGFFSTASERATQSIDAFLDAMGAGGALDADEEARLIANGWQPGDENAGIVPE